MNNKRFEKKQMNAMKLDILLDQMIATIYMMKADLKIDVRPLNQDVSEALSKSASFLAFAENMMSHPDMYKNKNSDKKEESGEEHIDSTCDCECDSLNEFLGTE